MTDDVKNILEKNIDLAISHNYKMSQWLTLIDKKGVYMTPDDNVLICHPLETVLIGHKIVGPINNAIINLLGVSPQWIDGFIDGYSNKKSNSFYSLLSPLDPARKRYIEGYGDGHEVATWIASNKY